jgi:hypothetical protein
MAIEVLYSVEPQTENTCWLHLKAPLPYASEYSEKKPPGYDQLFTPGIAKVSTGICNRYTAHIEKGKMFDWEEVMPEFIKALSEFTGFTLIEERW